MPNRVAEVTLEAGRRQAPDTLYQQPHWYACYTRSRHEKIVETLLSAQKIESYLPIHARQSRWKDRMKLVHLPLFPGYVFGRFTLDMLAQVLSTHGVVSVVSARGYPTPIPAAEIENVRRVSFAAAPGDVGVEPSPPVQCGKWVRVTSGPFQGVEGIVVEHRSRQRVLVGIAAIGQALEVDIDVAGVTPIPPPG
ncbi:UpxY family transcription antiterminator [Longimicrobium sp.]|uniref:UpxY family transcription antiterminator n=1 Tax=Longimicrobium sp. TaxID=2029185 RepID=UPI002C24491A|nr:UpxY family transcription antiterminator [Longimicrobium sp.]HSU13026.1 UpxY family transcription antiterminator [Longimicrobium sp.]